MTMTAELAAAIGTEVPWEELFVGDSIFVPGVGEGNVISIEGGNPAAGSVATVFTDLGELAIFKNERITRIDTSPFRGEALTLFEELETS